MQKIDFNNSILLSIGGFTHKLYEAGDPVFFNNNKSLTFNEDLNIYSLDLKRPNREHINICLRFIDDLGVTLEDGERLLFPHLGHIAHIGIINTHPQTGLPTGPILNTLGDLDTFMLENYNYKREI